MSLIEAIILGLIQGATEFLPISSSGHLLLVPRVLNLSPPDLSYAAIVHQGTLAAVLVYFFREVVAIVRAVWQGIGQRQPMATAEARLGWFIVLGTIPVALVGFLLSPYFDPVFDSPRAAAFFLIITALLLVAGERVLSGSKSLNTMSQSDALVIGLAQVLALLPGISRSGSTISAGLWRSLDRSTAARYSFLLGIPAILGAGLLEVGAIVTTDSFGAQLPALLGGFLAAVVSGLLSIHLLLRWIGKRNLYPFAIYCAAFGILYLLLAVA